VDSRCLSHLRRSYVLLTLLCLTKSIPRVFLSRPFKFVVGTEMTPIMVHEAAVSSISPALAALMQIPMSESLAAEVRWEDVDTPTFLRFMEFIYSGDYTTSNHLCGTGQSDIVMEKSKQATFLDGLENDLSDLPSQYISSKERKKSRFKGKQILPVASPAVESALDSFRSLSYHAPITQSILKDTREPDLSGVQDQSNVLLIHATLYALAEKWGVDNLKKMSLFKLHQDLIALHLKTPGIEDLVDLMHYAYIDCHTPDLEHGIDELRGLICHYVVANARVTAENPEFTALLKEEGSLASDLWKLAGPKVSMVNPAGHAGYYS